MVPTTVSRYVSQTNGESISSYFAGIEWDIVYEAQGFSFDLHDNSDGKTANYQKVFVVGLPFSINNGNSGVSYRYDLTIQVVKKNEDSTPPNYTSLGCPFDYTKGSAPSKSVAFVSINDDYTTSVTDMTKSYPQNFTSGLAYYTVGSSTTCTTSAMNEGKMTISGEFQVGEETVEHSYTILVFIDLTSMTSITNNFTFEDFDLTYDIVCTQLD